jgi:hypothetical protein
MSDMRSSKELVKSLRDYSEGPTFYWGPICQKAAEEIERLQRELAASAAQYQEACDDANRFARERDEARASPEPADELYALLVRRGYAQHEAHAIAFGDKLAVLSSSPPPDADPLSGMTSVQALEYLADEFCTGVDVKINATLFKAGVNLGTVLRAMRRHANFPAGTASTQQVQHECLCSDGYCLVSRGGTTSAQCREELRAASTKEG